MLSQCDIKIPFPEFKRTKKTKQKPTSVKKQHTKHSHTQRWSPPSTVKRAGRTAVHEYATISNGIASLAECSQGHASLNKIYLANRERSRDTSQA